MILMSVTLAAAATVPTPAAGPVIARMGALYEEVCLAAFPYDGQVDAALAAKGDKPLTPEQVKVTLRDDPGRGWLIEDADGRQIQVMLELPPYHACSVRRMTGAGLSDPAAYRAVVDRYKSTHAGFAPGQPMDETVNGLHIQATVEQRALPGGGGEALMVFEQRVAAAKKVAAGDTMVSLRFVHQIASAK